MKSKSYNILGIPYISDTVGTNPEAGLFGFMMSTYASLLCISIWNASVVVRNATIFGMNNSI